MDLESVTAAVRRVCVMEERGKARTSWHNEVSKGRPHRISNLKRKEAICIHQLRLGKSPLLRNYLHSIGKETEATCRDCEESNENAKHLLLECPRWTLQRRDCFGLDATPENINDDDKVIMFLRKIGRI